MKVVINACWGGFGLSQEAEKALVGKCEHVKLIKREDYYGDTSLSSFERDYPNGKPNFDWLPPLHEGQIVSDDHGDSKARTCPALIAVVEEMGRAASGSLGELKIVEIPDGTAFEIDDYDGMESVHEVHQSWS